jgi:hypothetical protein
MAYIASSPETHKGEAVGTGQCVAFVQKASGAPLTSQWHRGIRVKGNGEQIEKGTAIATFDSNGVYGNHMDGTSHAAIYVGQEADGIQVWDQWLGQPVHQRTLHFHGGAPDVKPVNDGDAFYVID